ncbi:MAG TPA: Flp family type IVb pilin [Terracidiphilus sp.]
MNGFFQKLCIELKNLALGEDGQDLVEYGLLISLIALAAIISIHKVTAAVNAVFTSISTSL